MLTGQVLSIARSVETVCWWNLHNPVNRLVVLETPTDIVCLVTIFSSSKPGTKGRQSQSLPGALRGLIIARPSFPDGLESSCKRDLV